MCVEECPTENFAFVVSNRTQHPGWLKKMICKDGVSPNTPEEANDMIDMNTCAEYYLKSREGESAVCTFSVRSFHKLQ